MAKKTMDKYKNKKAELRAWAKDDIVPSDLQWLCNATAEIIEQLQAENKKLKDALNRFGHHDSPCAALIDDDNSECICGYEQALKG